MPFQLLKAMDYMEEKVCTVTIIITVRAMVVTDFTEGVEEKDCMVLETCTTGAKDGMQEKVCTLGKDGMEEKACTVGKDRMQEKACTVGKDCMLESVTHLSSRWRDCKWRLYS